MNISDDTSSRPMLLRREHRCPSCGYGAIATVPPSPCPMCGSGSPDRLQPAELRAWRHLTLRLLGPATLLITPTGAIDPEAGAELSEAVAEHVHDQHEIVVDLTGISSVADDVAELLVRLGALARAAGGRLLTVCPASGPDRFSLHEVDPDHELEDAPIEGALGRTLERLARVARQAREGERA